MAKTVGVVSLGCAKNRIDTEQMLGLLRAGGWEIPADPSDAEVIIVNTCGFIDPAKQESIDTILEMAEYKKTGHCRLLAATGCLVQRYSEALQEQMPEIDLLMGVNQYQQLPDALIESAKIDGASEYRVFLQFVIPLSAPILAVLALYYGIGQWNGYFNALLYLGEKNLQPLALYVRRVVIQNSLEVDNALSDLSYEQVMSVLQIKYAVIVVAVLPILLLYPLLSKYLQKGMLVGSLKG